MRRGYVEMRLKLPDEVDATAASRSAAPEWRTEELVNMPSGVASKSKPSEKQTSQMRFAASLWWSWLRRRSYRMGHAVL